MVLPYRGGYGFGQPRRIGRSPIWQEAERLEPWNPYYRKDLTGGDDEISLEDALGEKPQKYVPAIDQQPLRPGELTPGDPYRQAPDPFGVRPTQQASWTSPSAIVPPTPPQQDTQSVAAVFGNPQSGATAMARKTPEEVARMLRDYAERNPWDAASAIGFAKSKGLDATLGAPDWSPPDTGALTPEDMGMGRRRMSDDPSSGRETPPFGAPLTSAQRSSPPGLPLIEPPRRYDPLSGVRGQALGPPRPLGGTEPASPLYPGREARDVVNYQDALTRQAGGVPTSPFVSQSPGGEPPAPLIRPMPGAGVPGGIPPGGLGQSTQSLANIFGGGAGPPSPFAGAGRPPGPVAGLSQMTPNIPPARPFQPLGGDRMPLPRQTAALGTMERMRESEAGLPRPRPEEFGPPSPGIPAQLANLRNGPNDITRGLIAGGQEARLPNARPSRPGELAGNTPLPPIPTSGAGMQALPDAPRRPTDSFLTGLPSLGAMDQTIDPSIAARRAIQMNPGLVDIPTPPGLSMFNDVPTAPLRRPPEAPLISEAQKANPALTPLPLGGGTPSPLEARLPRPRPPDEAMGSDVPGPQSSLPTSVMESIRASYDPTASGGPTTPETLEEAAARLAADRRQQMGGAYIPPTDDLIAGSSARLPRPRPEYTPPASVPLIEPVTLPNVPSAADMNSPAPLIAPPVTSSTNPRLSPKEIEKRARTRGFGTVENLTGDRIARGVGAVGGAVLGAAAGGLPLAASLGTAGYRWGDDVTRAAANRRGIFGLGGIFGMGRKKRDRDKEERANGTPPSRDPAGVRESSRSSSGLGSDRGNYGYSTGGRNIIEGVGGRYGLR